MGLKRADEAPTADVPDGPAAREAADWLDDLMAASAGARRLAAAALATHPEACRALCDRLATEPDESVRTALFNSVVMIGGPDAITGLMPLLRSEDAGLRNAAIEALAELPDALEPAIDSLLTDADPDVRIFTANILGLLPHPRVQDWLIEILSWEPDVNVVATAIDALAEVGTTEALPALAMASRRFSEHPFIAFSAEMVRERIESA